jgi:MATE family multidrug resistance protein
LIATVIAFIIHLVAIFILVEWLQYGLYGISIATTIHLYSRWHILEILTRYDADLAEQNSQKFNSEIFANLYDQFIFCLKGTFSVALPWWAADAFLLMSTYCGKQQLAAMTILRNLTLLTYMFPVGISMVVMVNVGNTIGQGNVSKARYITKLSILMAFIWTTTIILMLNVAKSLILGVFTADEELIAIIDKVWVLVNIFIIFDINQGTLMGTIKGLGA